MPLIAWQEKYRVGDAIIDNQHRYLFSLANDLVDSQNKAELTVNVMKLFRYVREHFDYEEDVMRKIAYPGLPEHREAHETLITQLTAISLDIAKDRWSTAGLERFMNEWLSTHIVKEDGKFACFIHP